jgi:hypothetical protein
MLERFFTVLNIVVFNGMKDNKNEGFKNTHLLDGKKRELKGGKQIQNSLIKAEYKGAANELLRGWRMMGILGRSELRTED